ncbi:MAG: SRPBCC family protein [Actinobacteria bacterium]|nr:MAG: SRPBCC family protein [Actinomycetota bacterium]
MLVGVGTSLPCPPEEAWAILLAWERQADWMLDADRVEVVSQEREGVGVRLAVRTRILGLPAFTEAMEVTGWEPPRRLVLRHGGLVAGEGTWSLTPEPGGTRFDWIEDVRLRVPVVGEAAARFYAPVLRWLMGRGARGLREAVIASGPWRR